MVWPAQFGSQGLSTMKAVGRGRRASPRTTETRVFHCWSVMGSNLPYEAGDGRWPATGRCRDDGVPVHSWTQKRQEEGPPAHPDSMIGDQADRLLRSHTIAAQFATRMGRPA